MKNERGQVIVFVAFALVGLIAITGLAIDGGRLYQARRQSQNGADAAALAGARVMASHRCNPPSDLDARVETEVLQYAAQNSVLNDGVHGAVMAWYVRPAVGGDEDETERLTRVGSVGSVSEIMGATGIEVTTTISEPTTFMRITGQDRMAAAGDATAMFGPITSGGGFLPIAVPVERVEDILSNNSPSFIIFDGSGAICHDEDVDCPSDPPAASQRAWLNFNYIYNEDIHLNHLNDTGPDRVISTSASNAEQKAWAETGCPHPLFAGTNGAPDHYYTNGDYIVGNPGARDSSRSIVCDVHMGEVVFVPLFDYVYQRADMQGAFPGESEPDNPLQFPNAHFYHIVGFVGVNLTSCGSGSNKTIVGTFVRATIGEGQIDPGEGIGSGDACSPSVHAVVLWK